MEVGFKKKKKKQFNKSQADDKKPNIFCHSVDERE